ncbi:MAG: DUF998 domain-containing protein [Acidimicrobiales bacterium]
MTRAGEVGGEAPLPSSLHGGRLSAATWVMIGCGLGGALVFTAAYAVEGVLRPGYDAWGDSISTLSLGPFGWVQQLSFVVAGVLLMVSALGWHWLLAPGTGWRGFPLLRALAGLGLIMDGGFATDSTGGHLTVHGEIHGIFAFVALGALASECFVLAERLTPEPGWRNWGSLAALAGTLTVVFAAMFAALGGHGGVTGLFERLAGGADTAFGLAMVTRLVHQAVSVRPARAVARAVPDALGVAGAQAHADVSAA